MNRFLKLEDLLERLSFTKTADRDAVLREARDIVDTMRRIELDTDYDLLVGGVLSHGSQSMDVINPATGQAFARCPVATRRELDVAVSTAQTAQAGWAWRTYERRRDMIGDLIAVIRGELEPLSVLLVREQGKPLAQARDEIQSALLSAEALANIEIGAVEAVGIFRAIGATREITKRYRPLGVVGVIAPWNAPVKLALLPMIQALYTGNAVIVKPSPYTPLTMLKIGELVRDIFPRGLVSVLAGGDDLGRAIAEHPGIDKLTVTGSVETGRRVMASAAGNLKRLTLELGGNNAVIVLEDAKLEKVVPPLFEAWIANASQVCMAPGFVLVHRSKFDAFVDAFVDLAKQVVVGDGMDPATTMGPIQNRAQHDKLLWTLSDINRSEERVRCGGWAGVDAGPGYFLPPTIVTGISYNHPLWKDETFGPILPIMPFGSYDEAIAIAARGPEGLCGSVWGEDLDRADLVAERLDVFTAWVNQHRHVSPHVPFGGAKQSGLGQNYGLEGLRSYMQLHVTSVLRGPIA